MKEEEKLAPIKSTAELAGDKLKIYTTYYYITIMQSILYKKCH